VTVLAQCARCRGPFEKDRADKLYCGVECRSKRPFIYYPEVHAKALVRLKGEDDEPHRWLLRYLIKTDDRMITPTGVGAEVRCPPEANCRLGTMHHTVEHNALHCRACDTMAVVVEWDGRSERAQARLPRVRQPHHG
jgi:hypothetical protein